MRIIFGPLILCTFCLTSSQDRLRAEDPKIHNDKSLTELLEPLRNKYDLPALAAAVVTSKGLEKIGVVGFRKRESDVPVTVNDTFHLASDTKALTASLIGCLVEEGKLTWDVTLLEVFPEIGKTMPPSTQKITLKQLLTHRAGLPGNPKVGWWSFHNDKPVQEQRLEVVKWLADQKLDTQPGEKFIYSNVGYVVVGAIAEQRMKLSWEELVVKKICEPLGMKSVGFGPMGSPEKIDQPWPHKEDGTAIRPEPSADNPPVMGPAGRMHCTLSDWSKFIADQLKGARRQKGILKAGTYQKLQSETWKGDQYTLGAWMRLKAPIGHVLAHEGNNTMNHSSAFLLPEKDVAVLVVCNQGGMKIHKPCEDATRAIFEQRFRK